MKRNLLVIALFLLSFAANAQKKDVDLKIIDTDTVTKAKERGYFQKAYVDPGDPRFMMTNADDSFQFGIGGIIHATSYYDFNGATVSEDFVTWHIPVPTANTTHFGIVMGGTRLFAKGVSKYKNHEIVTVLELNVSSGFNDVNIRNAYISLSGLTIGKTYSFFTDLDAGPITVDNQGPNTQIENKHPLIGYRTDFGKHFNVGIAAENPYLVMSNYDSINYDFQKIPDVAAFVQFNWKNNHVQLSQLCRWLDYINIDSNDSPSRSYSDYTKHRVFGYGLAFSGKLYMAKDLFFTYQLVGGRGISSYIQELAESNLDLVTSLNSNEMKPLTTLGGYVALQYDFTPSSTVSLTAGTVSIQRNKDENYFDKNIDNYKSSYYFAISAFRKVFKHGMFGIEYLHGERKNIDELANVTIGRSSRIDMMFQYTF